MKCDLCGKGKQYGHHVSHSGVRTKRVFKPNLHRKRLLVRNGPNQTWQRKKVKICSKCLKLVKSDRVAHVKTIDWQALAEEKRQRTKTAKAVGE